MYYQIANEEPGGQPLEGTVHAASQGDADGEEVGEGIRHLRDVRRELVVGLENTGARLDYTSLKCELKYSPHTSRGSLLQDPISPP